MASTKEGIHLLSDFEKALFKTRPQHLEALASKAKALADEQAKHSSEIRDFLASGKKAVTQPNKPSESAAKTRPSQNNPGCSLI